jgi:hypothetical protein
MTVENYLLMRWRTLERQKVYTDAMNNIIYWADAPHWALLTDPVWNIHKLYVNALSNNIDQEQETGYWYAPSSLAYCQTLIYS